MWRMMKRGLTQKEIARRLGVSQALVSRALSGTSAAIEASPVTVAAIRKAAAEWHYRPNAAAQTLKGAPTRTLGVIVKNFDDPFFGHLIGILQRLAQEQHYGLLLTGWTEGDPDTAPETMLLKYQPDGLIVAGSDYAPPAVKHFVEQGRPVVQIGLGAGVRGVRQVAVDEKAGVESLVEHLVGLGHRRIGYLGDASLPQQRREAHVRAALKSRGLAVRPGWFLRARDATAGARAAAGWLLAQPPDQRPTALMAADDTTAQRVARSLHERGIRVPAEMSLVGFDDIPSAATMIPALTSVRQPVEEMVHEAFRMVMAADGPGWVVVAPQLVVRESSAPPQTREG